jgi:muramoyltetrapeptide carboxypeptidase
VEQIVRPSALKPGDRVAIVSPGGPIEQTQLENGISLLRSWDLKPVVMPHALDRDGYLAGSDEARSADLHQAWADTSISAILCSRGGYGSLRILDRIDFGVIAQNPKIFLGFSDITALHLAILGRVGLITFHGPAMAWTTYKLENRETILSLKQALMSSDPIGVVRQPQSLPAVRTVSPGTAEGRVLGGNLSMLCASLGTPDEPQTKGALILIEEVGEPPFRVDRMLTQLLLAKKLQTASGIVIGQIIDRMLPDSSESFSAFDLVRERLGDLNIPVIYGLAFGHGAQQLTIPLGVTATLDANQGTLSFGDAATI